MYLIKVARLKKIIIKKIVARLGERNCEIHTHTHKHIHTPNQREREPEANQCHPG